MNSTEVNNPLAGTSIGNNVVSAAGLLPKVIKTLAANGTISVPAGHCIDFIAVNETNGADVTGGLRFGTTGGGTDIVAAFACAANSLNVIADSSILKRVFSVSAAQTVFIEAVVAWNGASVNVYVTFSRLIA